MNFIKSPLGFKITTRSPFCSFALPAWLGLASFTQCSAHAVMTTCADVTDCLLFRHLALFLGGVGLDYSGTKIIQIFIATNRLSHS
jgi:hypothetical protein